LQIDPLGAPEKGILMRVGSPERLIALLRGGPPNYCDEVQDEECLEHLMALLTSSPDSAYAPFVSYSLADSLRRGSLKVQAGKEKSINLLNDFLQQWPAHPRAHDAMAILTWELYGTGKVKESQQMLARFANTYPERKAQIARLARRTQMSRGADVP
jgi:hypothetical protein